jgi:hypothetical protein
MRGWGINTINKRLKPHICEYKRGVPPEIIEPREG